MEQRSFGKKVKPKKQIHFEDSCLDGGLVCDLKVRFNAFRLPLNSRLPCSNDGMKNMKRSTPKLYKDLKAHLGTFMSSLSKDELCDYILQLLFNCQSDVKSRSNQTRYLNESITNSSPDGSIPNCSNDLPSKQLGPGEEHSGQELVEEAFEGRTDNPSDRCLRANDQSDFHKIISAINLLCDIRSVFDQSLNRSVEPNNVNESRRTKNSSPFGIDKISKRLVVSLGDVIGQRKENITEVEAWALLCQAVQALQDLFLNGGEEEKLRAECTLNGVQLTPKGRVILGQRSRPISHPRLSDTHLEKMWIYSLGVTVRGIVSWQEASIGLKTILSRMLSPDLHSRASLMDLLDVISAYCRGRKRTKPLSHVIMDMYSQTVNHIFEGKNVSPNCIKNNDDIKKVYITPNQVVKAHFARVGARLYAQPVSGDKYFGPNTLIGPEFIIRSSEPTTTILMGVGKLNIKRRVLVVLLNGKKLEVTCDASTVTFADVFQVVASKEGLELSVTLGLACLVSDDFVFPPAEFKISKVAPPNWSKPRTQFPPPFTVYLRFKLYLPSLRGTRSWKWKHLLYLQLRRALLERQLRAEKQQLLALAGLALQAEFGDHSGLDDGDSYFLAEHYVPDEESSAYELSVLHRQRAGLDPGRAEEMFISHVMALPEYGTQYTSAYMVGKEESSTEMWIGVNSKGVVLCYKRDFTVSMVREPHYIFNWPDIKKLSYSKHLFEIVSADSKYKLKLECNKSLYLFRMAWLHHKFFMKMTNEYTTLQCLTEEFGLKIKPNKSVLHVSPDNNKRTELSALRRAASLLSPDRAIFRGKTATHCGKTGRSESYREMKSPSSLPSSPPSSALSTLSYHSSNTPQLSDEVLSRGNGARRRVLMGTRAIFSNSQHDLRFSSHSDLESASPLPEAYVLNTNIRSEADKFHTDFNETISESLAEKFNEVSFSHDRILTTVKIERDSYGSFGLQVVEGRDGHAYIISTIPGTAAYKAGSIHSGDQIQAVNGKNVLSTSYTDVLKMIQNSGSSVQLILSQLSNGRRTPQEVANMAGPKMKITDSTGFDLMTVLQKPIEESYLNAIRYQIATETDDSMMTTDLPRPSYL